MKPSRFGKGKGKEHNLLEKGISRQRLEAIVFDFDGTLAELRLDFGDMRQRLSWMASEYLAGEPMPHLPVLEWLDFLERAIQTHDTLAAREFRSRASRMIVEMELQASREGVLFPFTRLLLKKLNAQGVHTAIITRNCAAAVEAVFPDMENFCGCFLARDHVVSVKPAPEHLQRALAHFGAAPGNSLMVGDHPLDVQTGKRAGTLTAGVASGSGSWDDLARSGADWLASDCEELIDLLESNSLL
jgi:phosphoglycolate phosphatase